MHAAPWARGVHAVAAMLDRAGTGLAIFEDFQVDRTLPKFLRDALDDSRQNAIIQSRNDPGMLSFAVSESPFGEKLRPRGRIGRWWDRFWTGTLRPEPPTITVEEFFRSAHNSLAEIRIVDERAKGYAAAIAKARGAGQWALAEQLVKGAAAERAEAQLAAMGCGLNRYVEEADLVAFVKKAPKAVRLDWIRNFARLIPDDVLDRKAAADRRHVFDNYVVCHYDPERKSWAETEAERAARRDPILFGLIDGRRRLYFVGDWIDETCDLTLDEIADRIGREAIKEIA
jgi:hypothetical protein